MNWSNYPNFTEAEFACSHCGKSEMKPAFMDALQALRIAYGVPMRVTSGYRCPEHPVEVQKTVSGAHTSGCAADIAVQGTNAYRLVRLAVMHGFTGIGVQQKGAGRFIHLDTLVEPPRPNIWSY